VILSVFRFIRHQEAHPCFREGSVARSSVPLCFPRGVAG
jgi:hypothetical protein